MRKKLLLTLLLSSFLLIGCNSNKSSTNTDTLIGVTNDKTSNSSSPTPTLVITDTAISCSPYLSLGNLIFFPDKENNNRLSTMEEPKASGYINQSNIKDIFEYPIESIAAINDIVYFSNGSDGNTLYSLNYQNNEAKKINNNYALNLTATLDTLYYINKNDNNKLYFYNAKDSTSGIITNDSFGKFIINGDYILYQNLSDKANLYSIKLDGSNKMKLTDVSVDSFIPYESEVLYINSEDNNTLYRTNPSTRKTNRLTLVHGENLKISDKKAFIIDNDSSNRLSSLTIDFGKNTASTSKLTDDAINNYFPTQKGIFLEKSPDVNKSFILK
ncbi:DUF5050 domain-containing protein [Clostridium gasigenes]|uniref:DUF5050 domain-containing protein n=1 Tax=Clostridium gasigenes TaxID=94869 RepID=UPI001C0E5E36|nr:DUF5050 domain-containing protein [Clostridium gasigenes]MBU3134547.1 DUF5050 domain-containing protein [Clostridium gasigenes]